MMGKYTWGYAQADYIDAANNGTYDTIEEAVAAAETYFYEKEDEEEKFWNEEGEVYVLITDADEPFATHLKTLIHKADLS